MTFQRNSAFDQESWELPEVKVVEKPVVKTGVTDVHTSDIEELEHDLRDLEYGAPSPESAQLFHDLANRVASFYKG
jgi:hypothetical protein